MNDLTPSNTPAPAASNTPAPSGPTAPVSRPAELSAPSGSALQIAQMLAAGTIDTRQAGHLSKAANIDTLAVARALHTLREVGEAQKPDVRSPEVLELDRQFPPARPEEYLIRYGEPGREPTMTPELQSFDQSARTWMSTAGMPREIGNSLVSAIGKTLEATKGMRAKELESYRQTELMKLQRAHGEKLEERLQAADDMINQLEQQRPGLFNLLGTHGIGKNAMIWNTLIQHAQIFHVRRKR